MVRINKKITIFLLLIIVAGIAHVAEQIRFLYFNPDSVQSNLQELKSQMDPALQQQQISATFQAFSRFNDIEQHLKNPQPALLYVPFWYYQRFANEMGLRPLFQSTKHDSASYLKKLIVNKRSKQEFINKKHISLAMTTMGPDSQQLLTATLEHDKKLKDKEFNIIEVPKDADAVFAVALGQVDSALVSTAILELLTRRNPRLVSNISIIAQSQPMQLPVLCYQEGRLKQNEIETLRKKILQSNRNNLPGILGIDAWRVWQ